MKEMNFQIKTQRNSLEEAISIALELTSNKSDGVEVSVKKIIGISVSVRHYEVENIEFNNDGAIGITVYHRNRKGSAFLTELSKEAVSRAVQAALDIVQYTSSDPCIGIADKELLAFDEVDLDLFHPSDISLDTAIELAVRAEKASFNVDKRIINTEGSNFNSHYGIKVFGNSHGMLRSYFFSHYSLSNCVVSRENRSMERDFSYTVARALNDLKTPEWVGINSARRALSRLSSRKLSTMKAPVIFYNEVANELFGHLAINITGDSVYRRSTFLINDIGKQIFPKWLTIEENPHVLKGLASAPFDSEGVRTKNSAIIKNGVLTQWLLNSYSARKLRLKSTGHSGGIYNWYVSYQEIGFKELLEEMKTGLIVAELMGQGVNNITGDYSRGVSGFWVEHGKIQYPVSEVTISGNLKEMWRNIIMISKDVETRTNIQCGSVLISEMQISGK